MAKYIEIKSGSSTVYPSTARTNIEGGEIDIKNYTSESNNFICPCDGFVRAQRNNTNTELILNNRSFLTMNQSSVFFGTFVPKGTSIRFSTMPANALFIPIS